MAPNFTTTILSLAAGLSDPLNPHVCVCCLAGIVPTTAPDESLLVTELRRNQHHFLNTAVSYIIANGSALRTDSVTVDRRAQLQLWVLQCMSSTRATEWRLRHQDMLDVLAVRGTYMDVEALCIIVGYCLAVVRRHPSQRFSRHLWPSRAEDVLPAGSLETMRSLCVLLERVDAPAIALFALDVHVTCDDELRIHRAAFIKATIVAIGYTAADIERRIHIARSSEGPYEAIPEYTMHRLDNLAKLLFEITVSFVPSISETYAVERMIPAINRALDVATKPSAIEDLACIGGTLHEAFRPSLALHPRIEDLGRFVHSREEDPYLSLHQILVYTILRRACAGPGCAATEREISRSLSMCGRCRIVRYCSQTCQKKHWRTSHKFTCNSVCMLFNATGISSSQFSVTFPVGEFTAACRAARFSEEDILTLARAFGLISVEVPNMRFLHGTAEAWEAIWLRQFFATEDVNEEPEMSGVV
ncbi:hypothetical protein EXIGLDRAFT_847424 [Exidia glandulosa HHB12029]|uniref:MYND-type domain-containing protein n=1 Tax=Exidia glandulosa HHB12029 TaxID=1314781 RepID=A0A166MYJ2_EXIGL|nr:hypothetical protein EXIGLDRAFT_847424 [Exidia glandulosa HHB12029]